MTTLGWHPVAGGKLAVTHRPKLRTVSDFRAQGCDWVVSLLGEAETPLKICDAVRQTGMGWIWLERSHGRPPEGKELHTLWRQVSALAGLIESGNAVLIHCSAGQHRTGMVSFMLLRALGVERDAALVAIQRMRPATREGLAQDPRRMLEPERDLTERPSIDEPDLFGAVVAPPS